MSNRDGKHTSQKWKEGKICPKCKTGNLKPCDCKYCKGHKKHNLMCSKCKSMNF